MYLCLYACLIQPLRLPESNKHLFVCISYTAWWQRYTGVNNLPKVVTQLCPGGNWTHNLLISSRMPYRYASVEYSFLVTGRLTVRWCEMSSFMLSSFLMSLIDTWASHRRYIVSSSLPRWTHTQTHGQTQTDTRTDTDRHRHMDRHRQTYTDMDRHRQTHELHTAGT